MEGGSYSFAFGMEVIECLHGIRGLLSNQSDVLSFENRAKGIWDFHKPAYPVPTRFHGKMLEFETDLIYNGIRKIDVAQFIGREASRLLKNGYLRRFPHPRPVR